MNSLTKARKAQRWAPYFFVSPFFLIFGLFSLFPILFTLYISLTDWSLNGASNFIGFGNYAEVLQDSRFYDALLNTVIFMIMIIPPQIIIALFISVLLTSGKVPFVGAFRLINFLPYITTSVAVGLIFGILFDWNFGTVNTLLQNLGVSQEKINWLGQPGPARIVVSLVTVWKYFGYTAVMFLVGITGISRQLYEASDLDGATKIQQFRYITLPMLRPVMLFVVMTTMIGCFQIFDEPYMLFTGMGSSLIGGPEGSALTGTWLIYDNVFGSLSRFGYGSAIAYVLFLFICMVSFVTFRMMNKGEEE
ncbi:carbohydrate ABC transporter permease [Cohnella abietis]|uniref:Sugar ABC transporter ATP-binding protein n=1 Tax=Cohnella abietis TaxID=2507935 RepID=A0A3T1D3Z9_9BACL|nr:sugar ABC transporter permease [Cohnella abietis]BBI32842.1 sugar ABC transporter ATP-binding protein [Cohnella abietis]